MELSEPELIFALKDPDRGIRSDAALALWDSFNDEVGEKLIDLLLSETEDGPFRVACKVIIPKWIVKLEHRLASIEEWPFNPLKTKFLVKAANGWRLPSIESRVPEFLNSPDWSLKLAGLIYCRDKHCFILLAVETCREFLAFDEEVVSGTPDLFRGMNLLNHQEFIEYINAAMNELTPDGG